MLGNLPATHLGQDHIGQQQGDRLLVVLRNLEGSVRACALQNPIAACLKDS